MLKSNSLKQKAVVIFGNEKTADKFPLLNKIIAIYVAVTLIFQASSLIAPVLTVLSYTPLYHFKTYLGIIGALLVALDVFTNKAVWRGAYCYLWYGICGIAVISSFLTFSYGFSDNLFLICWVVIEIALFYSLSYRFNSEQLKKYIFWIFSVLLFIWFIACLISVGQFMLNISYSYVADPISADKTLIRQGFIENRLFGVFNPINHAAYISLMLSFIGVYFIPTFKKLALKISYGIACGVLVLHIILSGSRSALISLLAGICVAAFFILRNKLKMKNIKKILVSGISAVLVGVISIGCYSVIKDVAELIPRTYASVVGENEEEETEDNSEDEFEDILDRDLGEDTSNSRFEIWGDYISAYKSIGLLGLSPGNYMSYIMENNPELYIVEHIKEKYPEKYEAGIIFHVHNGYLMVFVATGFLGLALLVIFLILCVSKSLIYLFKNSFIKPEVIVLLVIAVSGGIAAFFDRGIFLSDNGQTFIFWLALGILMKIIKTKETTSDSKEEIK